MLYWARAHYVIHLRSHCHKPGNEADSQSCWDRVHNITSWAPEHSPKVPFHQHASLQASAAQWPKARAAFPINTRSSLMWSNSSKSCFLKVAIKRWAFQIHSPPQPPELPSWSNCPKLYFWNFVKPKLHTVDPSSLEITIIVWGLL